MTAHPQLPRRSQGISNIRWTQLAIGIVCMAMVANCNTAGHSSSTR